MSKANSPETVSSDRVIVITRTFSAPRSLVWKVWTEPEHIAKWWGPKGFSTRVTHMDLRVGGTWRYVMQGPDGTEYPVKGVFSEIAAPERIVTTDEFDEAFPFPVDELLRGIVIEATFDDLGDKTQLNLRIIHRTAEGRQKHAEMGVIEGWNSSFDCMDEHLASITNTKENKMSTKIFVNLPVKDLKKSIEFFTQLGYSFNPQFTDDTATCMIISDDIYVMLLTEAKFKEFTPKPICDATKSSEVLICLSCESKTHVDELVRKAIGAGGSTFSEPKDYGFMYQHQYQDLDGHIWELIFMEPSHVK